MHKSSQKVPAVVIGFNGTALGIIRELGRRKVPVIAVDSSRGLGYFSRYSQPILSPPMEDKPEAFLEFLITLSRRYPCPVLFPSNDNGVLFMARHYDRIEPCFRMTFQKPELIERIVNKGRFYRLARDYGMAVPKTLIPEGGLNLSAINEELSFPVILKPFFSTAFEGMTGKKLIKIVSPVELEKQYEILQEKFPLMVQEIIAGPDEEQFSCAAYIDKGHRPLGVFSARKIRSHPIGFGVGTLVESIPADSFTSTAVNFLRDIGYVGLAEAEFKRDSVSGQYRMIEINTRSWAQNVLAEKCGIPLSYIAYRDLTGEPQEPVLTYRTGAKWISVERDIFAYLGYRERGLISACQYLQSLRGVRVFSIFAFDDPMPFFYYFFSLRHIRLRTILKKRLSFSSNKHKGQSIRN